MRKETSLVAQMVKRLRETRVQFLGWEDTLDVLLTRAADVSWMVSALGQGPTPSLLDQSWGNLVH